MNKAWLVLIIVGLLILWAAAGEIGRFVGKSASDRYLEGKQLAELDAVLMKTASELNKRLPRMVDRDTRLDSTVGVSKRFQYHHTLVSLTSSDIDQAAVETQFAPEVRNRVCTAPEMRVFLQNGVTIEYVYRGREGKWIATVATTPSDCGY